MKTVYISPNLNWVSFKNQSTVGRNENEVCHVKIESITGIIERGDGTTAIFTNSDESYICSYSVACELKDLFNIYFEPED